MPLFSSRLGTQAEKSTNVAKGGTGQELSRPPL
jgi:hypothetical protein